MAQSSDTPSKRSVEKFAALFLFNLGCAEKFAALFLFNLGSAEKFAALFLFNLGVRGRLWSLQLYKAGVRGPEAGPPPLPPGRAIRPWQAPRPPDSRPLGGPWKPAFRAYLHLEVCMFQSFPYICRSGFQWVWFHTDDVDSADVDGKD